MRGMFAALLLAPALAYAEPAPGIDVHIDLHLDPPAPPPIDELSPPGEVAPLPDRTTPRRWVSLAGSVELATDDGTGNDGSVTAWAARAELDLARRGNWIVGAAAAYGSDERFLYGLGPPNMRGYYDEYDGAMLSDIRAVGYVAHVTRRGRFELRLQGGLGIVSTKASRWSDSTTSQQVMFTPIAEAAASISVDVYGPIAFAIGPIVTAFHQRFSPMTTDPEDDLRRGIDLQLQSGLRWRL